MGDSPTADDIDAWERYGYCCACWGCDDHPHVCDRSAQERLAARREHDETLIIALTRGPGRHRRANGSEIVVQRGPGDPEWPKYDGFDGPAP